MPRAAAGRNMREKIHSVCPTMPVARSHKIVMRLTIRLKHAIVGLTLSGGHPSLMKNIAAIAPLIPEMPERTPLRKPATMLKGNSREVGKRNPCVSAIVTPTTIEPTVTLIAAGFILTNNVVPTGIPKMAAPNIWRTTLIAIVFRSRSVTTAVRIMPNTNAIEAASFGGKSWIRNGAAIMMKPKPVKEFMKPATVTTMAIKKVVIGHLCSSG